MRGVRPAGDAGHIGLLLPTAPQGEIPVQSGRTTGRNSGGTWGTTSWLRQVAEDAETLGAGALWAVDHLFWGRPMLECLTVATVAATATRHVTVGTCVLQLPLRSPAAVAKQAATVQTLSGGRFVLGVGTGSHPGEYAAAGASSAYPRRGHVLDDGIDALRAAWSTAADLSLPYRQEPAPAPVPVWIGGSSAAARRRAAARGDGWIPLFLGPDDLARGVDLLRQETAAAGRDPMAVTPAVVLPMAVGTDPATHERGTQWLARLYGIPPKAFARHLVAGSPDRCAEVVARYQEAGAEHVVVMVADDDALGHFARLIAALEPQPATRRPWHEHTEVPA